MTLPDRFVDALHAHCVGYGGWSYTAPDHRVQGTRAGQSSKTLFCCFEQWRTSAGGGSGSCDSAAVIFLWLFLFFRGGGRQYFTDFLMMFVVKRGAVSGAAGRCCCVVVGVPAFTYSWLRCFGQERKEEGFPVHAAELKESDMRIIVADQPVRAIRLFRI